MIAVEPSSEMIGQLRHALPGIEALEGSAERIPIAPGRVDVVTAGQAFHWFDAELALPEIARVLRPGGTIGLLWNLWDEESLLVTRLYELLPPFGDAGEPTASLGRSELFGALEEASFHWIRALARAELVEGSARNHRSPRCQTTSGRTGLPPSAVLGRSVGRRRPRAAVPNARLSRRPSLRDVSGL
ncbi:MAG: class I SAM-dependent methyltransferase [Gaiellaceae bacterium]